MKVYIAAPYQLRDNAIRAMNTLHAMGHIVTSCWLLEAEDDGPDSAQKDLDDIAAADALVLLHPEEWHQKGTGGRHVEFGYALALGKKIILLGQRTNNFHRLPSIRVVERLEDL